VHPLRVDESVGRALAHEDKVRLLKVAVSREDWQNAGWAAILALNTTMRGCEIKQLRWRDVNFLKKTLTICKSKTKAGERLIPLNNDAWNAVLALYRRARGLAEVRPEHYVFPSCEASHFDPERPIKGWRTAWRNLTSAIECPKCGKLQNPADCCSDEDCRAITKGMKSPLAGLRFHDLRHHAITELAESPASALTIMQIAGHVSPKMLEHYSHVRTETKRTALDALSMTRPGTTAKSKGYDTNNDTKTEGSRKRLPQVIEKMVELVGIEPTTSSLRTMRSPS